MSLGVNGATVFAQDSNHQTAKNHCHRDTSGYDPSKQTKYKCTNCGCWATKGKPCYQCHRNADGTLEGEQEKIPTEKAKKPGPSKPDNANQHKFREQSAYDPKAKLRCKCPSCGCWVTKGQTCKVCKRVTT